MKVALIPCGATDWQGEQRLMGRVELPLTSEGQKKCGEWAEALGSVGLDRILHAPDDLAKQTASVLARRLSIPTKSLDDLAEFDIGLWAGLTESQLKTRYASAHRELRESPMNVKPPGGESMSKAASRLNACIRKQIKKNDKAAIGVVVRPFTFAIARCVLEDRELTDLWESARQATEPVVIDYEQAPSPQVAT